MTITPSPPETHPQRITLEEWKEKATKWKLATRELVRLWVINGFGSQRELARHLGMSQGTIGRHVKTLRASEEITEEDLPFVAYNSRKRSKSDRSVENEEPIDVEVEVINDPTPEEIRQKLRAKQTTTTQNNVRRPTERPGPGPDPSDLWGNTDAEHWQHVQDSDEPDSYKRAQHLLTEFSRLLRKGHREGWSEEAFASLRDDLEGWARTCAACSGNSRERAYEAAEKAWASLPAAVQRGEGGSLEPGSEGS